MKEVISLLKELSKHPGATPGSYSRVNSLLNCPYQWKLSYIDRAKKAQPDNVSGLNIGKFLHEVAETTAKLTVSKNFVVEDLDFSRAWGIVEYQNKYPLSDIATAKENLYDNTFEVVQRVFSSVAKYNFQVASEVRLCINTQGYVHLNVPWRNSLWVGILDLHLFSPTSYRTLVIDWKSHASDTDLGFADDKETKQVKFYSLLEFYRNAHVKAVQTGVAYFGDKTVIQHPAVTRDRLPELESEFMEFLTEYHDKLIAGKFDPVRSSYCDWCGYKQVCPLF